MSQPMELWESWVTEPSTSEMEGLAKRFCRELLENTPFLEIWGRGVSTEDELSAVFQTLELEIRGRLRGMEGTPRYGRTRLVRIEPDQGFVRLCLCLQDDRGCSLELILPLALRQGL